MKQIYLTEPKRSPLPYTLAGFALMFLLTLPTLARGF